MFIHSTSFTEAYINICKLLIANGEYRTVRGLETKELTGVMLKIDNPRTRLIASKIRKTSIPFAIGEWLWCMQGRDDLEMIQYYAPTYYRYSDDSRILHGAYGPRILPNISKVIRLLKADTNCRQAVIPIYSREDVDCGSKDVPCTLFLQFLIRNNKLDVIVSMRSNDIYLGFPYDIFNFSMFQEYVASNLRIDIGSYIHMVGSIHYYLRNENKIREISNEKLANEHIMPRMPWGNLEQKLQKLYQIEENIRTLGGTSESIDTYFDFFINHLSEYGRKKHNKDTIK